MTFSNLDLLFRTNLFEGGWYLTQSSWLEMFVKLLAYGTYKTVVAWS